MLSESARMSSAAEARFRLQAPNSKPRAIKVIALDGPSEGVVRRLAKAAWSHATFFTASSFAATPQTRWFTDLAGRPRDLVDEVGTADLVVMVAVPGGHAHGASIIGEACSDRRVNTTALIAGASSESDEAVSKTLKQLRPWALMLVVADADDYIDDMLAALRA